MLAIAGTGPALAQDEIFAITEPAPLNEADASVEEVGELIYRGGLVIEPGEEEIGGISSLEWHEDRLYAVSDDGHWLTIEPDEFDGQLIDVLSIKRGDLLDERGRRLRGQENVDAEAITRVPNAEVGWAVAFERRHRIWSYFDFGSPDYPDPAEVLAEPIDRRLIPPEANQGIETLASVGNGELACLESYAPGEPNCLIRGRDQGRDSSEFG